MLAANMGRVMVNMDKDLKAKVEKRAKEAGRSVSGWMAWVVKWYIDNHRANGGAK